MPRLKKRTLEVLHSAEIRKIAMLGMEMDVSLAYAGDSENVLNWMINNQDRFLDVDIDEISKPTKPENGSTLRDQVIPYIKELQRYLRGEQSTLPDWGGLEGLLTETPLQEEDTVPTTVPIETIEDDDTTPQFPEHWLTKKGTPDKRKAAVRAVLDGEMTIEDALKMEAEMKYIPKKTEAPEPVVGAEVFLDEIVDEILDPETPEEQVKEKTVLTSPKPQKVKKAVFKKASLGEQPQASNSDYDKICERIDYVAKTASVTKQQVFENKFGLQAISKRMDIIENALLFLINSAVLGDTPVSDLEAIPTPEEY